MKEKFSFNKVKKNIERDKLATSWIVPKEKSWDYKDSPMYHIGYTFAEVLPNKYTERLRKDPDTIFEDYEEPFRNYIENTLRKNKEPRTAIEFGGQGSTLFSEFSKNFFNRTVGVCLKDVRQPEIKGSDKNEGHSVIEGNVFDLKNKDFDSKIQEALGTKNVDLIISRMAGPLSSFSRDPLILDRLIRKWYKMLNRNGLIFAQFELFYRHMPDDVSRNISESRSEDFTKTEANVKDWVIALEERLGDDEIEIEVDRGIIRIHKKDKAPDELPKLKELFK